jgi:hypothetical protein
MPYQLSISNLSMGLIQMGLTLLQNHAFPVYLKNIIRETDSPIAHGESTPSSIAVLLITTGLDHHLARLKFIRDYDHHDSLQTALPYFKWQMGDDLCKKVEGLLIGPKEKTLKEQLIELTILRDCVAHPKFYIIKDSWSEDHGWGKSSAILSQGAVHREKARTRKRAGSERTKLLALPFVSTWISYRDVVMCVILINRFLHLLARRYGHPYANVPSLLTQNVPDGFFNDTSHKTRRSVSFDEWTRAFYRSLSSIDKKVVGGRLGSGSLSYGLGASRPLSYVKRPQFLRNSPA